MFYLAFATPVDRIGMDQVTSLSHMRLARHFPHVYSMEA